MPIFELSPPDSIIDCCKLYICPYCKTLYDFFSYTHFTRHLKSKHYEKYFNLIQTTSLHNGESFLSESRVKILFSNTNRLRSIVKKFPDLATELVKIPFQVEY